MPEIQAHIDSHGIRRTGPSVPANLEHAHFSKMMDGPLGWLPALFVSAFAIWLGRSLPAWQYMWLCAFAIFFSVKWLTWLRSRGLVAATTARILAYFFCR